MIVGIEGILEKKEPTFIHLNVSGIVYEIFISINCSAAIIDKKVKLFITQIIKEDSNNLYGFLDINEKKLFDTVIKINGVGPKVALAICSTFTPNSFANIVSNGDVNMLKAVPGIGPKSAKRILVELAEFIVDSSEAKSSSYLEAFSALQSLGFKKEIIEKVLNSCEKTLSTSELVKEALKRMQK